MTFQTQTPPTKPAPPPKKKEKKAESIFFKKLLKESPLLTSHQCPTHSILKSSSSAEVVLETGNDLGVLLR